MSSKQAATPYSSNRFCVAPMLDCTDRHDRFMLRLISKHALLYTEMVTTGALLHGDSNRFLRFNKSEHPLALQLGGSEPSDMARCAVLAQQYGYDEVNINVGCPSDRVQSGQFGACLMLQPQLVADNVKQMQAEVDIPVTVKTRIGVDEQEPETALWQLVESSANAGCKVFLVHARKAWLQGLSPKQNRNVPPLDYEIVYKLKQDFPELEIIINGGIEDLTQCQQHLQQVDGVMVGREAYANPFILSEVDRVLYDDQSIEAVSRDDVLEQYIVYMQEQMEEGVRFNHMSRHVIGLFHGEPRSKLWRRHISENAHLADAGVHVLQHARQLMLEQAGVV